MNPLVEPYKDAPWLTYTSSEPSDYALNVAFPALKKMLSDYPLGPDVEIESLDDSTPEGAVRTDVDEPPVKLFIYKDPIKHKDEKRILYYIHGGAYIRGNGKYCRNVGLSFYKQVGLPVAVCEYRTSPKVKYPAHLDDSYASWRYIIEKLGYAPENIIVAGESAGGSLTAGLIHRLKRLGEALPQKIVLLSPSLDATLSLDSYSYNADKDKVFIGGLKPGSLSMVVDDERAKEPEMSAYYGDFSGFPPTYFACDDTEVFCSDTLACAQKLYEAGVPVKAHVYHNLWHVFPTYSPDTPESKEVYSEIKAFIG